MNKINKFRGDYAFLSNFYPCTIRHDGMVFKCSESLFQSYKCVTREATEMFQDFDGPTAKRMSHKIKVRDDWHDTFWGVSYGVGENYLGRILMLVRKELMEGKY